VLDINLILRVNSSFQEWFGATRYHRGAGRSSQINVGLGSQSTTPAHFCILCKRSQKKKNLYA